MRETWSHTGTSQSAVTGFSGFAGTAAHINETFGTQVTRQLIYNWWARRGSTNFPDKKQVKSGTGSNRDLMLFDLDEVISWYEKNRHASHL